MLLGTWNASLLENLLQGKGVIKTGKGETVTSEGGRGTMRTSQRF